MTSQSPLQVLADKDGSVAVGWVGEGVVYTRFVAGLSASLGATYSTHLQALLSSVPCVRYFADISALKQYDLLARSAFVRVVHANRRRLSSMLVHTRPEGLGLAARTFTASLGNSVELVGDWHEFETQLLGAAPRARERIDPRTWTPPGGVVGPR
jgi:hypothetical protein